MGRGRPGVKRRVPFSADLERQRQASPNDANAEWLGGPSGPDPPDEDHQDDGQDDQKAGADADLAGPEVAMKGIRGTPSHAVDDLGGSGLSAIHSGPDVQPFNAAARAVPDEVYSGPQ